MKASAATLAVLAAACKRDVSGPPNAQTAAPASPTASSAPPSTVELKPGPHSRLADVDLPAGVAFAGSSSLEERWSYSAPYDDTVVARLAAVLQRHAPRKPAGGLGSGRFRTLAVANANNALSVQVFGPSSTKTPDEIVIDFMRRDGSYVCNRQ
jgi:hypothetical protein